MFLRLHNLNIAHVWRTFLRNHYPGAAFMCGCFLSPKSHKWDVLKFRHSWQNVLLLVGINHTGGWHYNGCDLLTCALLAHAHQIYTAIAVTYYHSMHIIQKLGWYSVVLFASSHLLRSNYLPHISTIICSFMYENQHESMSWKQKKKTWRKPRRKDKSAERENIWNFSTKSTPTCFARGVSTMQNKNGNVIWSIEIAVCLYSVETHKKMACF